MKLIFVTRTIDEQREQFLRSNLQVVAQLGNQFLLSGGKNRNKKTQIGIRKRQTETVSPFNLPQPRLTMSTKKNSNS